MSFTDTAKHWLCGCADCTADSRSVVNVAMPHLRGKWSPTKAIFRTLVVCCIGYSFAHRHPCPVTSQRAFCRIEEQAGRVIEDVMQTAKIDWPRADVQA